MAYDEDLADRVRQALRAAAVEVDERRMFGGLAFMVHGHMTTGVLGGDLIVRVGKDAYDDASALPGARPFDFTGRPSTGMVVVTGDDLDDAALERWLARGLAFTSSLPAR